MVALKPIHERVGIERLVVSTYQSVSGTGVAAIEEMRAQARAILAGEAPARARDLPVRHRRQRDRRGGQLPGGRRLDRRGAQDDVRDAQDPRGRLDRHQRDLRPRPGALQPLGVRQRADARAAERGGVPRAARATPPAWPWSTTRAATCTPRRATPRARDEVFVGRIREDASHPRALNLWVVSDNLRKGAATNAVQLAELLHQRGLVGARSGSPA